MEIKYFRHKPEGVALVYIANKDLSKIELYCKIDLDDYLDVTHYCQSLRALSYIDEEIKSLRPDAKYVRICIQLDNIGIFTTGFLHLIHPGNQTSKFLNIIGREIDGLVSSEDLKYYIRNTWYRRLYVSLNEEYIDKIGTELYNYLFNGLRITINDNEIIRDLQFHGMSIHSLQGIVKDTVNKYIKENNVPTGGSINFMVIFYGNTFKLKLKADDKLNDLLDNLSLILIKDNGYSHRRLHFTYLYDGFYSMEFEQTDDVLDKVLQEVN